MPAPLAKGIIITVSVILAAGLAAYENPQVREWIDRSRQKIAMALYSLGDDIHPRPRSPRQDDPSTREEMTEIAEARRRLARAEIMERGRILEERRKRKRTERDGSISQASFDTLSDDRKEAAESKEEPSGWTTSTEPQESTSALTSRNVDAKLENLHESVDSPLTLRQLDIQDQPNPFASDPFADHYEQQMRTGWNMHIPHPLTMPASSHASESLLDITPTSEHALDPPNSVPSSTHLQHPLDRSEYFSTAASNSSHTLSEEEPDFYYAHPENPFQPLPSQELYPSRPEIDVSVSSAPSVSGSVDHVHASEAEESDDGVLSEFGDGIRTPASAWTDVGSVVSNDD